MNRFTGLASALFSLTLAQSAVAHDSVFYSAAFGPASIGVSVNPRSYQLNLSYDGFLNECDAAGYLKPVYVHFIFQTVGENRVFTRKMSGECRTNSHPEATGQANFQSIDSSGEAGELWALMERTLGEDDGQVKLRLAFERDGIWDNAKGMNFPIDL